MIDAIIVGGSYAGLSAALQLARARRDIVVIDGGSRRNRFAETSHGFLGQDGRAPGAIATEARAQLMAYPSVRWIEAQAKQSRTIDGGFAVDAGDARHEARRLILATGVVDALPAIPGLTERWGKSVFHCPYCHGYELNKGRIGVLGVSPMSMHHALMLPDWGETTFFVNDAFAPDDDQIAQLKKRNVTIEHTPILAISGDVANVELQDGRTIALDGLFTMTHTSMASPLAEQLGCGFEQGPTGPFIRTDITKETSIPGVFACGDAARAAGSVAFAVGDGAQAGVSAHRSLMFGDF
jgi:thioredoxin reductase